MVYYKNRLRIVRSEYIQSIFRVYSECIQIISRLEYVIGMSSVT